MNVEMEHQEKRPIVVVELSKCSLCLDDLSEKPVKALETCSHKFHEKCLKEYLDRKIDVNALPLRCPRQECLHTLRLVDLMDLVEAEKQEKYIVTSLKAFIESNTDACCCPTPGCNFAFLKTYRASRFRCSLCKKTYCMSCRTEWHKGLSCEDYQATYKKEAGEESKIIGRKIKQCPTCKIWVGKKPNSNRMECKCGVTFSYCCGRIKIKDCDHQENEQIPIVQTDLFHRAMESPQEYTVPLNNKWENNKTITSEVFTAGGASNEAQKACADIEKEKAVDLNRGMSRIDKSESRSKSREKL